MAGQDGHFGAYARLGRVAAPVPRPHDGRRDKEVAMDIRHHPSRRHGARGATLLELLFVCALLAALATWSAPSFHRFVLDARRAAQVSGLFRALQSARSSAVAQALPVVLCKSNNSRDCTPHAKLWSEGWLV